MAGPMKRSSDNDKPLASPMNGMQTRGSEKALSKFPNPTSSAAGTNPLVGNQKLAPATGMSSAMSRNALDGMDKATVLTEGRQHLKRAVTETKGSPLDVDKSIHHRMGKTGLNSR